MGSNYVEAMCDKFIEEDRSDNHIVFVFVFESVFVSTPLRTG